MQIKRTIIKVKDFTGLGAKIREARKKDDRSLVALCRACNISRAYWYQIEVESLPSPISECAIRKIETVLGIDLNLDFDD